LTDSQGSTLCFNGEIFAGLDIPAGANDGKALLAALQQASAAAAAADAGLSAAGGAGTAADTSTLASAAAAKQGAPTRAVSISPNGSSSSSSSRDGNNGSNSSVACVEAVVGVLSRLRGPWSLIYWQKQQQTLWFGRDVMGKAHAARIHTRNTHVE
jgi:hypothetical protein